MLRKICALVLVLALAFSLTAFAAESTPTVKEQNAVTKLARGAVNLLAGWLEFPKQIYLVSKKDNPYIGLTYGFVKGIYEGLARTGMGIFETVTCILPPYDRVFIRPEFVFEGWN